MHAKPGGVPRPVILAEEWKDSTSIRMYQPEGRRPWLPAQPVTLCHRFALVLAWRLGVSNQCEKPRSGALPVGRDSTLDRFAAVMESGGLFPVFLNPTSRTLDGAEAKGSPEATDSCGSQRRLDTGTRKKLRNPTEQTKTRATGRPGVDVRK